MSDYDVGYRKPPLAKRFVKGKSGNPRGRPPKNRYVHRSQRVHLKDDMVGALERQITVTENGKTRRMAMQRMLVRSLVDHAINGHGPAMVELWTMFKHFGLDVEPDKMIQYSRLTPTFWAELSDDALFRVPDSSEPSEIATGEKRNGSSEQHASSTQATEPISFAKREREELPSRAHIMDDLLLELQQPITITESGRSRRISKQQALLMAILQQVMRGKRYAWKLFWSMFTHFALDQEPDIYLLAFRDDPDSPTLQEELDREQW